MVLAFVLAVVSAASGSNTVSKNAAKITAASTYYDRKEGLATFTGHVFVEDEKYQLHADRAFVFMEGTNELNRIVALGNVAMTNGARRAYGVKASYYRNPGMVVLYGGDGVAAEVLDETPKGNQVVKGKKIKFWTASEQVEVLEAELSAPSAGLGGMRNALRR